MSAIKIQRTDNVWLTAVCSRWLYFQTVLPVSFALIFWTVLCVGFLLSLSLALTSGLQCCAPGLCLLQSTKLMDTPAYSLLVCLSSNKRGQASRSIPTLYPLLPPSPTYSKSTRLSHLFCQQIVWKPKLKLLPTPTVVCGKLLWLMM